MLALPIVMPVASSMRALTAPVTGTSTTTATPAGPAGTTTARTKTSAPPRCPPVAAPGAASTPYASTPSNPSQDTHAGTKTGARLVEPCAGRDRRRGRGRRDAGPVPPQRPASSGIAASESPGYALPASVARRRRTFAGRGPSLPGLEIGGREPRHRRRLVGKIGRARRG